MILAYRDAEAGRLDLDARYRVRPEDMRRGTGLLQTFAAGIAPTYRDIITQMIVTSDNSATDSAVSLCPWLSLAFCRAIGSLVGLRLPVPDTVQTFGTDGCHWSAPTAGESSKRVAPGPRHGVTLTAPGSDRDEDRYQLGEPDPFFRHRRGHSYCNDSKYLHWANQPGDGLRS